MSALVPGSVVAGRYHVVSQLGEGGMGAVYRARQEPLGREVALKVMAHGLASDPSAVERFHREARASSSLSHPNIVTVFDFGEADGSLFMAMELIAGSGLDGLIERGPLPWSRALRILRGICAALSEAHAKGIVHRDLKPANVIVTSTTTHEDIAKVVDFGIAKLKDASTKSLTMTGAVVGTPGYVAPELFHGHEPTPQADLYALGVIGYDILCGRPPFQGKTAAELLKQHLFDAPPPPSTLSSGLPPAFDALLLRLLEKDPARRPNSAKEVDAVLAALESAGGEVQALAPHQATEFMATPSPAQLVAMASTPSPPPSSTPATGTVGTMTGSSASSAALALTPVASPARAFPVRFVAASAVVVALVVGVVAIQALDNRARTERDRLDANARIAASEAAARAGAAREATQPTPTTATPTASTPTTATPPTSTSTPVAALPSKKPKKEAPPPPPPPPTTAPPTTAPPTTTTTTPASSGPAYSGIVPVAEGNRLRVAQVKPDSPAEAAGVVMGDLITRFDNTLIESLGDLGLALKRRRPGDRVVVEVLRGGRTLPLTVVLSERPRDERREARREERKSQVDRSLDSAKDSIDRAVNSLTR